MLSTRGTYFGLVLAVFFLSSGLALSAEESANPATEPNPVISITEDLSEAMMREAAKVREEFEMDARSLFERKPLGWDLETIRHLYRSALSLPLRIPDFSRQLVEHGRVLGVLGSLLVLLFVLVVLYSLLGQNRLLNWVEAKFTPLGERIPKSYHAYIQSLLNVVVSAMIPLALLGLFSLINAMTDYRAAWFQLSGRLLGLWAAGVLILRLLEESLTRDLFKATVKYGKPIFQYARFVVLYLLIGIAVFFAAKVFQIRPDVLALLRFVVSISTVAVLFLFLLKRGIFLSLLPELPYRAYRTFLSLLRNYYYPLFSVSFLAAVLWCFGYQTLGGVVLIKIWGSVGAFLLIMLIFYGLNGWLKNWSQELDSANEAAQFLVRSLRSLLLYAAVLVTIIIILNLLGLLDPLQRIISFPIFRLGEAQVTLWIILKAALIILAFVFATRLSQAYFDYKIYPGLGIDPGLGYALNTFFKYLFLAIGFLISLKLVGLNLRFLLVFAGAAGIGIGLGLQNMAANVISGFTIIFGGKIRKGDWIEVSGTLGTVTDIFLRATKVRTRDNIEYLIPNGDLISNIIVNYSLSSPMIRIELPVGVSYQADPREVERILVEAAEKEPLVSTYKKPVVRFVEYGDNSLNFVLLIWIDVRAVARRKVRSALYFAIFEAFAKAGIEIPFPQRDIHIRSRVD
jgi:small-conductance mechanosensitive channel